MTTEEEAMKEAILFIISDCGPSVEIERREKEDYDGWLAFHAKLCWPHGLFPTTIELDCQSKDDKFEFRLYEDNWEYLNHDNLYRWLFFEMMKKHQDYLYDEPKRTRAIINSAADYHIREMTKATGKEHLFISTVRGEMHKALELEKKVSE